MWQRTQLVPLADVHPPPVSPGKGRGRQVIAVARTADVVIMMLDATKGEVQRSVWARLWASHVPRKPASSLRDCGEHLGNEELND